MPPQLKPVMLNFIIVLHYNLDLIGRCGPHHHWGGLEEPHILKFALLFEISTTTHAIFLHAQKRHKSNFALSSTEFKAERRRGVRTLCVTKRSTRKRDEYLDVKVRDKPTLIRNK